MVAVVDADEHAAVRFGLGPHLEIGLQDEVAVPPPRGEVRSSLGRVKFALGVYDPGALFSAVLPGGDVLAVEQNLPAVLVQTWLVTAWGFLVRRPGGRRKEN